MLILRYLLFTLCAAPFYLLAASSVAPSNMVDLGIEIIPTIAINYKHDDNVTNVKNNKQASNLVEIMPALRIQGEKYNNQFSLSYSAKQSLYSDNKASNYTDHKLQADVNRAMNSHHKLAISYQFERNHDAANTGISEGNDQATAPAIFYTQDITLNYRYGSQSSTLTFAPRLSVNNKRYDEGNSNYTPLADFNEYDYGLALYYRLAASVNLLVDISNKVTNYPGNSNAKDSINSLLYSGINWDISGKTQGSVKLGYEKINVTDNRRGSKTNPSWDIGIRWSPKTYSIFNIKASQKITNAITAADRIKENTGSVNWQHAWRYNVSTTLAYQHVNETYQYSAREDNSNSINIALSYQLRYWLTFGLSYKHETKSSSDVRLGYDNNIYGLTSRLVF